MHAASHPVRCENSVEGGFPENDRGSRPCLTAENTEFQLLHPGGLAHSPSSSCLSPAGSTGSTRQSLTTCSRRIGFCVRRTLPDGCVSPIDQRRRLAVRGQVLGRRRLADVAGIVTPDTILRWYRKLVAQKYDGSHRRHPGRPRTKVDTSRSRYAWRTRIRPGATRASAAGSRASVTTSPVTPDRVRIPPSPPV